MVTSYKLPGEHLPCNSCGRVQASIYTGPGAGLHLTSLDRGCFQPGEGSNRGLLSDCKTPRNLREGSFEALLVMYLFVSSQ